MASPRRLSVGCDNQACCRTASCRLPKPWSFAERIGRAAWLHFPAGAEIREGEKSNLARAVEGVCRRVRRTDQFFLRRGRFADERCRETPVERWPGRCVGILMKTGLVLILAFVQFSESNACTYSRRFNHGVLPVRRGQNISLRKPMSGLLRECRSRLRQMLPRVMGNDNPLQCESILCLPPLPFTRHRRWFVSVLTCTGRNSTRRSLSVTAVPIVFARPRRVITWKYQMRTFIATRRFSPAMTKPLNTAAKCKPAPARTKPCQIAF